MSTFAKIRSFFLKLHPRKDGTISPILCCYALDETSDFELTSQRYPKKTFRDMDRFFETRRTRKNRSRGLKTTLSGRTFGIVFFGDPKNEQKHYEKHNVFVRFCSILKVQFLIFDHLELFLGLGTCFFEFYGFQRIDPCPVTFLRIPLRR